LDQIKFFAEQAQVYVETAKALHLKKGSGPSLRKDISLKSKKGLPPGSITVLAKQLNKVQAAKLDNTFVKQLGIYANQQLTSQYKTALSQANASVTSLSAQYAAVEQQIAQQTKTSKKTSPGKTTPSTTTTTAPKKHQTTTTTAPTTTTTTAPTTTTTTAPTTTTTTAPTTTTTARRGPIGTTTTVATTVPTTVPTTTPTTAGVIVLTAKSKSTATTASKGPSLQVLEAQATALKTEYSAAQTHLQQLTSQGAPTSGFTLLQAATPAQAKLVPAASQLLVHRSVRGVIGFVGGLVLGILVAFLLDGLDRRLRTAPRTSDVFGLPVIAEIPRRGPRGRGRGAKSAARSKQKRRKGAPVPDPVGASSTIAVADAPASLVAEAYRRLRVSVMFAPTTRPETMVEGFGRSNGHLPVLAAQSGNVSGSNGGASGAQNPAGSDGAAGSRDVILITSSSTEPTESEVVLNLAAAYAEAGERVLVVSTTDLRSNRQPISGAVPVRAAAQPVPSPAVQVHAGGIPENPTQPLPVVRLGAPGTVSDPPTEQVSAVGGGVAAGGPNGRSAVTVEEVVARCMPQRVSGVSRLQLGELLRGPGELATRGNAIISTAREIADVVIVEAPAVLGTPDAEALVRCVDAVLVVAESYCTTVRQARRAGELLRRVAAPTLGVVLTEVEMTRKELKSIGVRSPRSA
jgi:Mrp family chromosome partitioning ATPase/capsular polysaccharide biosynthesis protein